MDKQLIDKEFPGVAEVTKTVDTAKRTRRWFYAIGILGVVLTALMAVAIIYFRDDVQELKHYGYLGAFFLSILGGATIIVPVPALAIVFALGGAMTTPWQVALLGFSAAAGELIGSLTIYMTGQGAGKAISKSKHGKIQTAYEKMLVLMERRGPIILFVMASVINPFFYPAALAAGALRFGLKKYVLIVFAGKVVKSMTTVYLGYFGLKGILRAFGIDI